MMRKLAMLGLPVFPCRKVPGVKGKDKTPFIAGGFKNATTDLEQIAKWEKDFPEHRVGVPTGAASGIAVLDLDLVKHLSARNWLARNKTQLPQTRRHQTGGNGGWHLLFRWRQGLRCSTGEIALGVDVRAEGGYVIWWGSLPEPGFVVPKPQPVIRSKVPVFIRGDNYGRAALENEISDLAGTPGGGRNHALNRAAFCLFQLVAVGKLNGADVEARLLEACHRNGLIADDGLPAVRKTLNSGMKAGLLKPRRVA
jgi:hypothetical protein